MAQRAVIQMTVGTPGSGKSYCRAARFLVDEYLPETDGRHISNFPVNRDEIADWMHDVHGVPLHETLERIEVIPPDVVRQWEDEVSGPWEYFADRDLQGTHLALDEAHRMLSREHSKEYRKQWRNWLSEIRHQGCTVEFVTQSEQQLAVEVFRLAEMKLQLSNRSQEKLPIIGIRARYVQELVAAWITRQYRETIMEIEYVKAGSRWSENNRRTFIINPRYFDFYNSYSAPTGGGKAGKAAQREFQKRGRIGVTWWAFKKNLVPLSWRFGGVGLAAWIFFGGGISMFVQHMTTSLAYGAKGEPDPAEEAKAVQYTPPPGASPEDQKVLREHHERVTVDCCAQAEKLREQIAQINAEREAEQEMLLEQLEHAEGELQKVYEISLITEDEITFRNGYTYRLGELIDAGSYIGRTVESIDWRRRAATLDDGTIIRMGASRRPGGDDPSLPAQGGEADNLGAGVPPPVRSAE